MTRHGARAVHVAAVAAGFCLAVAVSAAAQPAPQAPAPAPAAQPATAEPGRAIGLSLTAEQRASIRTLREQQRTEATALQEQSRAARKALRDVQQAATIDEAGLRAAANAVAAAQADLLVLRTRHRAQFLALLTPEQQQQVRQRQAAAQARAGRRAATARRRGLSGGRAGWVAGPRLGTDRYPGAPGALHRRWHQLPRPGMTGPRQPVPAQLRKRWI